MGISGTDFVIASADTGVAWEHPALMNRYRGYNSSSQSVEHNYNWWDTLHESTDNPCGTDSIEPCDDNGHGTHTVGIAVGNDEMENIIGVAITAKWIGCRNMDRTFGATSSYLECLQFFLAPTDLSGNNPDPSKRPHAVINSYGCPVSEGCSDLNVLKSSVKSMIDAGIFMSVASGNTGSGCSTISEPPAIYEESFTVGASQTQNIFIASFSSRGPIILSGNETRIKPDIIAPGSSIYSSYPPNRYVTLSGTSMAAPHIAGIVALLYQANSSLIRDIDNTRRILEETAQGIPTSSCSSENIPNNLYGYGMVNALYAVNSTYNYNQSNDNTTTTSNIPSPSKRVESPSIYSDSDAVDVSPSEISVPLYSSSKYSSLYTHVSSFLESFPSLVLDESSTSSFQTSNINDDNGNSKLNYSINPMLCIITIYVVNLILLNTF